jgi:hypothetical protein
MDSMDQKMLARIEVYVFNEDDTSNHPSNYKVGGLIAAPEGRHLKVAPERPIIPI